jgi:hypothetical protein
LWYNGGEMLKVAVAAIKRDKTWQRVVVFVDANLFEWDKVVSLARNKAYKKLRESGTNFIDVYVYEAVYEDEQFMAT